MSLHLATMVLTASPSKRKDKPLSSHQIRKQKYKKISRVVVTWRSF